MKSRFSLLCLLCGFTACPAAPQDSRKAEGQVSAIGDAGPAVASQADASFPDAGLDSTQPLDSTCVPATKRFARCFASLDTASYCGGIPPGPGYTPPTACQCHECQTDADCGDGAKCQSVYRSGDYCGFSLRFCIRPQDACNHCPLGQTCGFDDSNSPRCFPAVPPRP